MSEVCRFSLIISEEISSPMSTSGQNGQNLDNVIKERPLNSLRPSHTEFFSSWEIDTYRYNPQKIQLKVSPGPSRKIGLVWTSIIFAFISEKNQVRITRYLFEIMYHIACRTLEKILQNIYTILNTPQNIIIEMLYWLSWSCIWIPTILKFGLSEKHTKFEKIFIMVFTNQLIYLANFKTMRKIFWNYECFSKRPNFTRRPFLG